MEALFKKYFWIVKVLGIAASTGLAASAIMTQLGSSVILEGEPSADDDDAADSEGDSEGDGEDGEDGADGGPAARSLTFNGNPFDGSAGKTATPTAGSKTGPAKQKVAARVTKRNMFCPLCVPPAAEVGEGDVGPDGQPLDSVIRPGEIKSSLPLRLVATMEFEDPNLSYATVYDAEIGSAGLFARGDAVRDGVVVMGVDQAVLHLRNHSQLEYLELGAITAVPKATTATRKKDDGAKPPVNDRAIEGAEEAIKCDGDTCTVDRKFVEGLMANPAQLTKQARIVPSQKDGETQGYKLYGIRRDTLPKLLGFKNGDMLKSVNGEELTSMDKAMGLYTKLRQASNLSIEVERKGATVTKEIIIQ
jgi:general secretion pathway protein C